ncbi:MAG: flagellar export chaperone FliS [Chloroflexi bacterium]|nr:flagellar export chaperone FliS [Chloroflexota bacterium]
MYASQGYQQYKTMQVQTADRGELVVMLYQGAIRFLGRSAGALRMGNLEDGHFNLVRAQDIVAELMGSLDMGTGDLARNLFQIYEYMHYRLVQANIHKDPAPVEEVAGLLRELLPAWQQAARQARSNGADAQPVAVGSFTCAAG